MTNIRVLILIIVSATVFGYKKNTGGDLIDPKGKQIISRINTPAGYKRIASDSGSFSYYLRYFPLKKNGTKVYLYNGSEKTNQNVYAAVLDIDAGNKDLQQCADAVMRLKAEYLFSKKEFDKIHFNFTNGFNAEYGKWRQGYRIRVNGNNTSWYKTSELSSSKESFKKYLEMVFSYAGTLSLSKEMQPVPLAQINIGDVFIHGGSPGHAVIVVDVAESASGRKIFMIAQSYMPAQDIHVLKNFNDESISPWYDLSLATELNSPEWTFQKTDLKRFKDQR